ncbi:MAG: hypothetical protein GF317_12420 [Candidatus Lokiarchaeota archaeon]|nr:hypothetical protein [Candidatus Lokiarchaeota archaeon]
MKKLLILFTLFLFCSCNKDSCEECNEIEHDTVCSDFILTAGESVHDSINYLEYNPIIKIKGRRFGTDSNYYYQDSIKIDLNNDGNDDLHFKYYQKFVQPSCDCEGIDCCMPWGESLCTVEILSNLELACTDYYGLNPDRLQYGDTIDSRLTWINDNTKHLFDAWGMTESPWDIDYYNSYMGYRLIEQTDTLYGWIRMNTDYADRIEIYDFVIEK